MPTRLGSIALALSALHGAALAEVPVPGPDSEPPALFPDGEAEPEPPDGDDAEALPKPSLREPFAIGEALYDPARVPLAVVSLLDLMGVPVVADQATADRAPALTLSAAELRALIDMGVDDATAATESEEGEPPFTFADLHGFVAPFFTELGVEELAEIYASAYERRPEDLAPQLLMGQPVTPETPVNRVQIWLLLVDGFAGRGAAGRASLGEDGMQRATTFAVWRGGSRGPLAMPAAAPAAPWGASGIERALQRRLGRLLDPMDLPWVTAHLPLIRSRATLVVAPGSGRAHEGHGGSGAPLGFEAKIGPATAPVVAPSGRAVLLPLANPALGGRDIRWFRLDDDEEIFDEHGTFRGAPIDAVSKTGPDGASRITYVPKREPANGRGRLQRDRATLRAQMKVWDLLTSRYEVAPGFAGLQGLVGKERLTVPIPVRIEWHSEGLELEMVSSFDVELNLGRLLGRTHRWGFEGIRGSLARHSRVVGNVTETYYKGLVRGRTLTAHVGTSALKPCPEGESHATQWLEARAEKVDGLNRYQDASAFEVREGALDGGYLRLELRPVSEPVFTRRDSCQDADELLRVHAGNPNHWLPFNDARWHTPDELRQSGADPADAHAWVIAIPAKGRLVYRDRSLADENTSQMGKSPSQQDKDLGPLGAIIRKTFTSLKVEVERTDEP